MYITSDINGTLPFHDRAHEDSTSTSIFIRVSDNTDAKEVHSICRNTHAHAYIYTEWNEQSHVVCSYCVPVVMEIWYLPMFRVTLIICMEASVMVEVVMVLQEMLWKWKVKRETEC